MGDGNGCSGCLSKNIVKRIVMTWIIARKYYFPVNQYRTHIHPTQTENKVI